MLIGDYTMGCKIGAGKSSNCFSVIKDEEKYCMKVITLKDEEKDLKKQIEKEIKVLSILKNHSNIICLKEFFAVKSRHNERVCLVTEMMDMNLKNYLSLQKDNCLEESNCKIICKPILEAVNYCHSKLITHQVENLYKIFLTT